MLSGGAASRLGRETCEWWSAVCWRSIYKKLDGSNIHDPKAARCTASSFTATGCPCRVAPAPGFS